MFTWWVDAMTATGYVFTAGVVASTGYAWTAKRRAARRAPRNVARPPAPTPEP